MVACQMKEFQVFEEAYGIRIKFYKPLQGYINCYICDNHLVVTAKEENKEFNSSIKAYSLEGLISEKNKEGSYGKSLTNRVDNEVLLPFEGLGTEAIRVGGERGVKSRFKDIELCGDVRYISKIKSLKIDLENLSFLRLEMRKASRKIFSCTSRFVPMISYFEEMDVEYSRKRRNLSEARFSKSGGLGAGIHRRRFSINLPREIKGIKKMFYRDGVYFLILKGGWGD